MKKLLSVLLSILMLFTASLPAFASATEKNDTLTGVTALAASLKNRLEPVVFGMPVESNNNDAVKLIDKLVEGFDTESPSPVARKFYAAPVSEPDVPEFPEKFESFTIEKFINSAKKYFIVNLSEVDALSQAIVDSAEFKYTTTADGKKTVYIFVNIEDNPGLLNHTLLRETCKKLYLKQNEEYKEGTDVLMSYQHIAGELALHALMYAVSYEYIHFTGKLEGRMYEYWRMARRACLNIDEDRLPSQVFEIVGSYVIGTLLTNIYRIQEMFKPF